MTVEYLRARLLSERSVSRTARQRAEELAKRVAELEAQLKAVSLQRKKAEKATADVLAILENHGISDLSEAFDSSSDQEVTPPESRVSNSMNEEETSVNSKARRDDSEEFSGSELESSPFPRSLSWKSSNDSPHSLEKKSMASSAKRCSSFASVGSSSAKQRLGKSCRQIRRREARSTAEDLKNGSVTLDPSSNGVATCSDGLPNGSENGTEIRREDSEIGEEKAVLKGLENQRKVTNTVQYRNGHGRDKDMERALESQAQLIGQHEAEEKAQREWEEKFRDNNNSTPDSCEPGNQSDVTEERDEIKPQAASLAVTITSQDQESKSEAEDAGIRKESFNAYTSGFQSSIQDQKNKNTLAYESPATDFAFPSAKGMQNELEKYSYHPPSHSETSGSRNENQALILHEAASNGLGGVLEALQQAKLSIQQKLNKLPLLESGSVGKPFEPSAAAIRAGDKLDIPVGCAGLFKVPTDFKFEPTPRANLLGSGSQVSFPNYRPDTRVAVTGSVLSSSSNQFVPNSYTDTRLNVSNGDHRFLTSPLVETESRVLDTSLPSSSRYSYPSYPSFPNLMSHMPSNEGNQKSHSSRDDLPFYDDYVRQNMYR